MAQVTTVCIGIQARSTSTRFPRKAFESIGGIPLLSHVIEACRSSAVHLNRYAYKSGMSIQVALLIPHGDEIGPAFRHHKVLIIDGDDADVLSRYKKMEQRMDADYIVRVTGDCPLIPPFLISKAITTATKNQLDYCSNVDENLRTAIDGFDVEVLSKRALVWLNENAKEPKDREHVTTFIRSGQAPKDFKFGHLIGPVDLSNMKLSVDTLEDLERVRAQYDRITQARAKAESLHGQGSLHRY